MAYSSMSTFGSIYIHATNIHRGGGKSLIIALLTSIDCKALVTIDDRIQLPINLSEELTVKRVKPSIFRRLMAEIWLSRVVKDGDVVLFFGNLPPLFRIKGKAVVFLQNRYLIDDVKLTNFSLWVRFRLFCERLWFINRMDSVDEFIVQTPTMKRLLQKKLFTDIPVRQLPFSLESNNCPRKILNRSVGDAAYIYDFIYVASGEPHKNHRLLFEAWQILAEHGVFPSLCITLDCKIFNELTVLLDEKKHSFGLKIFNLGSLSHDEVLLLYKSSKALIYPSTLESFGMPLIEAREAGLSIVASELDFVRDVTDPEETFDPDSPVSIARAVKRFLQLDEKPLKILDANHFLFEIFNRDMQ